MKLNKYSVAIIGYGWVGKSMFRLFKDAFIYDPVFEEKSVSKNMINKCGVAFVCVPTPNIGEGKLDISIVESVVEWCECDLIVIRSTVNPGTCEYLAKKYDKNIVMQPEYLGETVSHPMIDPTVRKFLVMGGKPKDCKHLIELYITVYNANVNIRQMTTKEAEVVKLSENRAIAFKVAQCQELYDVCKKADLDYYKIREAVYGDDPRFNLWWSFVFPKNRGFNSKCIPKDVYAWCAWAESLGYDPKITRGLLEKNNEWIKTTP